MRRLCFGGSFNPIHYGHLRCAHGAAREGGFERVVLVPAGVSPFRTADLTLAPAFHRCQMCRLAVSNEQVFEVSEVEIHRAGPSYTIDTVRELKRVGCGEVNWLIGADQLPGLPRWHQAEALLAEANFVILRRPGHEIAWESLPPAFRALESHVIQAPLIDISATDIRRRIAAGETIEGLTPPAVVSYIRENGLYLPPVGT